MRTPGRGAPDRGDLVWLAFDPQAGHEQAGHRPALILSPRMYNAASGLALCCPITSRSKGYPFEVPLPEGSALNGVILVDQVKSLDWQARRARHIARLPSEVFMDVQAKLKPLLWD